MSINLDASHHENSQFILFTACWENIWKVSICLLCHSNSADAAVTYEKQANHGLLPSHYALLCRNLRGSDKSFFITMTELKKHISGISLQIPAYVGLQK